MSEEAPSIRLATPRDAEALALVGAATFLETYAHMLPGADLVAHGRLRHSAEFYARLLGEAATTIWLAESGTGAPVGYLVVGPASLPVEAPRAEDLEVVRIYLLSRFHRTGCGHRLMGCAVAHALAAGARRLVLGVHRENARALAFYRREGFAAIATRRFQVGSVLCDDLVLAKQL